MGAMRPVLRRHLSLTVLDGEGAVLLGELGSAVLDDPVAVALLPLLDGTRSPDELVRALAGVATADAVAGTLSELAAAGLVVPADPDAEPREAAYRDATGLDTRAGGPCRLEVLGPVDRAEAVAVLGAAGLRVDAGAVLTVLLTDDYLRPDLPPAVDRLLAAGAPVLLARPVGLRPLVGPVLGPGAACLRCLTDRMTDRAPVRRLLTDRLGRPPDVPPADLPATRATALATVAAAVARLRGGDDALHTSLLALDAGTLVTSRHPVPRRPQCPACGDPGLVAARLSAPVRPRSRVAAAGRDGGLRARPASEMLAAHGHLVDPVTGVVEALTPIGTGLPSVHAYSAGPNPALPVTSLRDLRSGLRTHSCGKGDGDEQARAGALGEAVERASGVFAGDEPVRHCSLEALGADGIHPVRCLLFSDAQYAGRTAWNARGQTFQHVPESYPPDVEIDWTPVWSLTAGRHRYLPTALLFYGHRGPGTRYAWADSNGCAAGTSLEDALLQGLLELVERDAVAIWWYNRLRRPAVDLDATAPAAVARRRDAYRRLGRELWALDLTSDLGVPVVAAVSRRTGPGTEDVLFGFGAHPDGRIAAGRALAELDQFLPAVAAADGHGGGYRSEDPDQLDWWRRARVADHPHLLPDPGRPAGRLPVPDDGPVDLAVEFAALRARVEAAGMEVLAQDLTRPDLGLPVARVVVPGLRHFWARFAPGRLYDVPVTLGDRPGVLPERELNPVPLFV